MNEHEQMLTAVLNCKRHDLYVDMPKLSNEQLNLLKNMQQRRAEGEPLQYILGTSDFMGLPLAVDERVLIPRPETELLVEHAILKAKSLTDRKPFRILDMGTGSGNISIALAKFIDQAFVTTMDISIDAINLAKHNAAQNKVNERMRFIYCSMISFLGMADLIDEKFDMIISNPPYIKTSQLDQLPTDVQHEPRMALDGGEDGLCFYKRIISHSHTFLHDQGVLLFEIGDDQTSAIQQLFKEHPFYQDIEFVKDYTQTNRIVSAKRWDALSD